MTGLELADDDVYLIHKIKRSDFQAVTNKAIAENPGFRAVLDKYFNDIQTFTNFETSRGRMLHSVKQLHALNDELIAMNAELDSVKEKLSSALGRVEGMIWGTGKN